jgi:ERCC4-type nuclease
MLEIEKGQEYKNRGEVYRVEHVNQEVVLLQDARKNHRLERREYFETCVDEGFFEPQHDVVQEKTITKKDSSSQEVPFEKISWVGEKGAKSLREAGFETAEKIQRASDERLMRCDSVGETGVNNIREWIKNNT